MFTLTKHACVLAHLNVREEKHGEENVLAVDMKLTADVPNTFLDQLSPGLCAALYAPGAQSDIDPAYLSALRWPSLAPLEWMTQASHAAFVIHGSRKAENIEFEADINKLRLNCKEGGTVSITFRAQILPDPVQVGILTAFLGQPVTVSLTPAAQPAEPPVE